MTETVQGLGEAGGGGGVCAAPFNVQRTTNKKTATLRIENRRPKIPFDNRLESKREIINLKRYRNGARGLRLPARVDINHRLRADAHGRHGDVVPAILAVDEDRAA